MSGVRRIGPVLGLGLGLGLLATACAPQAPYFGPKLAGTEVGYTDLRLGQNRYEVTYTGNSDTDRQTVENFLLLRSAQVTLQSGFSHFVFDTRDTKSKTSYFSSFTGFPGGPGYGWFWDPWPGFGGPADVEGETRPVTRFDAYAEIVMLTSEQAEKEPRAIDAQQIIARLGPLIAPPPAGK